MFKGFDKDNNDMVSGLLIDCSSAGQGEWVSRAASAVSAASPDSVLDPHVVRLALTCYFGLLLLLVHLDSFSYLLCTWILSPIYIATLCTCIFSPIYKVSFSEFKSMVEFCASKSTSTSTPPRLLMRDSCQAPLPRHCPVTAPSLPRHRHCCRHMCTLLVLISLPASPNTHTHTHTHYLSLSHTHDLSHSLTLSLSLSLPPSFSPPSLSIARSVSPSSSLSLPHPPSPPSLAFSPSHFRPFP
jgi:hypothetical protein